jgi:hypothetical protein
MRTFWTGNESGVGGLTDRTQSKKMFVVILIHSDRNITLIAVGYVSTRRTDKSSMNSFFVDIHQNLLPSAYHFFDSLDGCSMKWLMCAFSINNMNLK